uniref:Uncharacterized protein n=1 Tax=Globodera rostochiensis TaxID=31243 RepID=A0A914HRK2_GLORO
MNEFWILILVLFFATNSLDKAESVKLELKTFDEIFGEGWWDKDETAKDLKMPAPTNFEQNVHHKIDRQNTQIGQIESNSTDQNPTLIESDDFGQIESNSTDQNPTLIESDDFGQIEPNSTDQLGQIEPNSTDQLGQIESNSTDQLGQIEPNSTDQLGQIEPNSTDQLGQIEPNSTDQLGQIEPNSTDRNPPPTKSDHYDNAENNAEDERKRKIVAKFHAMKDEFKQKGKFPYKERTQIEDKIAKHLKRENLVEKFDQMKAELKRDGFKNSYKNEIDETVAKELSITYRTISNWKSELGQPTANKYAHDKQKELLMKRYYEIKDQNHKISDKDIAKMLKIGTRTLYNWKKQFKLQLDSVEENDGSNVQETGNSNSGSLNK